MHRRFAVTAIVVLALCGLLRAEEPAGVVFRAVDVWMDSGEDALAAYQVEIAYDANRVKIVGLEGGQAETYRDAPFYDRRGFEGGRIIVAAFTTESNAPKGRARVARIHLAVEGGGGPELSANLMTAARPDGERIKPTIELKATPLQKRTKGEGE